MFLLAGKVSGRISQALNTVLYNCEGLHRRMLVSTPHRGAGRTPKLSVVVCSTRTLGHSARWAKAPRLPSVRRVDVSICQAPVVRQHLSGALNELNGLHLGLTVCGLPSGEPYKTARLSSSLGILPSGVPLDISPPFSSSISFFFINLHSFLLADLQSEFPFLQQASNSFVSLRSSTNYKG